MSLRSVYSTSWNIYAMREALQRKHDSFEEAADLALKACQMKENRLDFGDALNTLKAADPTGWSRWYDDNNNIPEQITWSNRPLIDAMIARIHQRVVYLQSTSQS